MEDKNLHHFLGNHLDANKKARFHNKFLVFR